MKSGAYPPLDGLVDLACRDGVDIRPTLLRVLTDLYVQKPTHSADEEKQYVELALGLIATVDQATRTAVAASLSAYAAAPQAILSQLGAEQPPRRASAPALPETERKVDPKPAPVADNLVESFFAATSDERRRLLLSIDTGAVAATRRAAPIPGDIVGQLENAALQRNPGEFSRVLERALAIGPNLADRIIGDPSGEPIVVAAKALGMKAAVLQRILLTLNPAIAQSVERVFKLADLYEELSREAADQMLTNWRKAVKTNRPEYEPVHWDDERRSARSLSTPSQYRTGRGRDRPADRIRSSGG